MNKKFMETFTEKYPDQFSFGETVQKMVKLFARDYLESHDLTKVRFNMTLLFLKQICVRTLKQRT